MSKETGMSVMENEGTSYSARHTERLLWIMRFVRRGRSKLHLYRHVHDGQVFSHYDAEIHRSVDDSARWAVLRGTTSIRQVRS